MWKTLAVGCFFFWLVYSTIYFFANKQELMKRDLEHSLEDAKSKVAVLKNEILDISYETDLLLRFQKENRRLLSQLKKIVDKTDNGGGSDTFDNNNNNNEPSSSSINNNNNDGDDLMLEPSDEVIAECRKRQEEVKQNLETEARSTSKHWLEPKIKAWEHDKVLRCEKERWIIHKKQQEGSWTPGDEKSPEWACHWNFLNIVLQFPNVMNTNRPQEKKEVRQREFNAVIRHTVEHPAVEKIHLFYNQEEDLKPLDDIPLPWKKKFLPIKRTQDHELLHYQEAFEYGNKLKGKIVMIQNADVFLDSGFALLEDYHFDNGTSIISLSRREIGQSDAINPRLETTLKCTKTLSASQLDCSERQQVGSHDAFIFLAPIRSGFFKNVDHQQNAWGAENVVVFELVRAGMKPFNPCGVLRIFHNHCSDTRPSYTDKRVNNGRSGVGTPSSTLFFQPHAPEFIRLRARDEFRSCVASRFRQAENTNGDSESRTVLDS